MSQIASGAHDHSNGHGHAHAHAHGPEHAHHHVDPALLTEQNTRMPAGWGTAIIGLLGLIGVAGCVLTALYPSIEKAETAGKHALASYHVGFIVSLSLVLGSLAFVLIMQLVKAGWVVTFRRQAENVASLVPLMAVLALPVVIFAPKLFKWMNPELVKTDHALAAKQVYLNPTFFYIRLAVYFIIWTFLALRLRSWSRQQDQNGDKYLTNKSGFTAAWGILAFALTTAFAAMDLLMSLDYHWFSTMFPVYFFAGCILSAVGLLTINMTLIHYSGRLKGLVTPEHFHDNSKLMFAFMVFWGYIGFSQYFLYWYANIPEETAWINLRGGGVFSNAWTPVFWLLILGHFLIPFPLLLIRGIKRTPALASLFAAWLIFMQVVDIFWLVRPGIYPDTYGLNAAGDVYVKSTDMHFAWVDITGVLGPLCITLAAALQLMRSSPLIPLKDPRLIEAAHHKNYV